MKIQKNILQNVGVFEKLHLDFQANKPIEKKQIFIFSQVRMGVAKLLYFKQSLLISIVFLTHYSHNIPKILPRI
jgi:hypothetical protein